MHNFQARPRRFSIPASFLMAAIIAATLAVLVGSPPDRAESHPENKNCWTRDYVGRPQPNPTSIILMTNCHGHPHPNNEEGASLGGEDIYYRISFTTGDQAASYDLHSLEIGLSLEGYFCGDIEGETVAIHELDDDNDIAPTALYNLTVQPIPDSEACTDNAGRTLLDTSSGDWYLVYFTATLPVDATLQGNTKYFLQFTGPDGVRNTRPGTEEERFVNLGLVAKRTERGQPGWTLKNSGCGVVGGDFSCRVNPPFLTFYGAVPQVEEEEEQEEEEEEEESSPTPPSAKAVTFVANDAAVRVADSEHNDRGLRLWNNGDKAAFTFRTGKYDWGYHLESIEVLFYEIFPDNDNDRYGTDYITATVHRSSSRSSPGTAVYTLTTPTIPLTGDDAPILRNRTVTFTAPEDAILKRDKTYVVQLQCSSTCTGRNGIRGGRSSGPTPTWKPNPRRDGSWTTHPTGTTRATGPSRRR